MTRRIIVGVLALQGAFYEHLRLLKEASIGLTTSDHKTAIIWEFLEVRTPSELAKCDALIIPGGESTTVSLVAERSNLLEPLREFVKYVYGYYYYHYIPCEQWGINNINNIYQSNHFHLGKAGRLTQTILFPPIF
jgi:hypothetical protein